MIWTLCIIGSYLVGSIPVGVLIGRAKGVDIRAHGSGNVGATNVGRVLGRPLGYLCFGLDMIKGGLPVLVAGLANGVWGRQASALTAGQMWLWLAVFVAAVIGHIYPAFLRLRGGKGVATGFGGLLLMWPLMTVPALAALLVWAGVLWVTRYVSLSSMTAAASLPVTFFILWLLSLRDEVTASLWHASPPLVVGLALAGLVLYRHRANIGRLRRGEEPKVAMRGE